MYLFIYLIMYSLIETVLGLLPTKDNSPPDRNEAQPLPLADPGFVKRGGRESKFPPGLKKSLSGGGGGDTFFPRNFWADIYIIG